MLADNSRKVERCLALLMGAVFATATGTPASAQPATPTPPQLPAAETPIAPGTQQSAQAFAGQLAVFLGHEGDLTSAQFSPNGSQILTASEDKTARLWDTQGNLLAVLKHQGGVSSARFSPDGRQILTVGEDDRTVRLWDTKGNLLVVLGHQGGVFQGEFSPDGSKILTIGAQDKAARLWDSKGNLLTVLRHQDLGRAVFSPDSRRILTFFNDKTARLWDTSGNLLAEFRGHEQVIWSAAFSPDGRQILTTSSDKTARLWDTSGNPLAVFRGHEDLVTRAVFSPSGSQILTSSWDATARLWDTKGNLLAEFRGYQKAVRAAFSPNGSQILTVSGDGTAQLWDTKAHLLAEFRVNNNHVGTAQFSPDGRQILTTSLDRTARLWDVPATIAAQTEQITTLQAFQAGVSEKNAQLVEFRGQEGRVLSAVFSPDGRQVLTANGDGTVRLWDRSGNLLNELQVYQGEAVSGYEKTVHSAVFSPDGRQILTASDDVSARLWDTKGNLLLVLKHEDAVRNAVFSPDSRQILTSSEDGTARLWDISGKVLVEFPGQGPWLNAVFSPDGRQVITANKGIIYLWDTKGNLLGQFRGHEGQWTEIRAIFSPDGRQILTADGKDKTARLWDTQGNLLLEFRGHENHVKSAVFSPDGRQILTASLDKTARLWDTKGNLLAVFRGHEEGVSLAKFSPDGRQILTASPEDGTARLWDVSAAIAAQAEQMAGLQTFQQEASENSAQSAALQEGIKLNQQGTVESRQLAIEKLREASQLFRASGNPGKEARALLLIGNIYSNLGQFQAAFDSYSQALPLSRQAGAKAEEAAILNSAGELYNNLADPKTALDYYNQALPLWYQLNDRGAVATTLNNIGDIHAASKEWSTALKSYRQALIVSRYGGNLAAEASALTGIGSAHIATGEWSAALNACSQALLISRYLGDKVKETAILNQMGEIRAASDQESAALEHYSQALSLSRELGYKAEEARILYNRAILTRRQNNLTAAQADIETAINIIEELRTQIDSEKLRQSYFAQNQEYYEFYIDLLMQLHRQTPNQGYGTKAFNASERARARTLLELLAEAKADIRTGITPELRSKESNLQQRINATAKRQMELFSGEHTEEQAANIKLELDNLLRQLDEIRAEIRKTSPRYAALTQPQPLTAEQVQQQLLDRDTVLLQYSLGKERSFLWAVTPTGLTAHTLPPRAEIEAVAEQFYLLMQNPEYRGESRNLIVTPDTPKVNASVAKLSQMLLGPVAEQLAGKRLLIVPDGVLHYIPFSALPAPRGAGERGDFVPLLVNHEIINLPSASTLAILRQDAPRQLAPKTVALIADPVFEPSDERVTGANSSQQQQSRLFAFTLNRSAGSVGIKRPIARLTGTRKEAEAILSLAPKAQTMQAFDFDASLTTLTNTDLTQYRAVHFATHGFVSSSAPELSGVVLSLVDEKGNLVDGFLRLHDIFNLSLNAQVVVLSACQTGLGDSVRGEGLVGLTRGFMYAGTPRLVVSLWSVDDEATAALMSSFYQKMLSQGMPPAQALRQTQLEMWQRDKWKSPYFWAAFTLQGEWR